MDNRICVCVAEITRKLPIYGEKRCIFEKNPSLGRGIVLRLSKTCGDVDGQNRPFKNEDLKIPIRDIFFPLGGAFLREEVLDAQFLGVRKDCVVFSGRDSTVKFGKFREVAERGVLAH